MSVSDTSIIKPEEPQTECAFCAEKISIRAKKCRHCGEILDVALRAAEEAKNSNNNPMVFMNAGGGGGGASSSAAAVGGGGETDITGTKSKMVAAVLAFLLGGIGIHKFYLGQTAQGVLYLLLCWTFIPMIIALIECVIYILSSEKAFAKKYG